MKPWDVPWDSVWETLGFESQFWEISTMILGFRKMLAGNTARACFPSLVGLRLHGFGAQPPSEIWPMPLLSLIWGCLNASSNSSFNLVYFTVILLRTENRPEFGTPVRLVAPAYLSGVPPRHKDAGWVPFRPGATPLNRRAPDTPTTDRWWTSHMVI